jgi:hypothetical protein
MNQDDGMSRRSLLLGGALGLACAGAAVAAVGASAAKPLPATPAEQMRLLLKMMASTARAGIPWFYTGRIYAVRTGAAPQHLYNFEGSEMYWITPLKADTWSMAVSTLSFFRDRDSGEYLDRYANPLTGNTVEVGANVLRSKPGQSATYSPGSMAIMGETQPVTMEIHRSAEVVWLTTSRANMHAPQPSMEVNTLFAGAAAIEDRRQSSVPATFSSVSLSRWSKWLAMGDLEGHLLWHAAGRKLGSLDELPRDYRARADRLNSPHFTNPEAAPAQPSS